MKIWLRDDTKSESTWIIRLFDKLNTDKISNDLMAKNEEITQVYGITPINDRSLNIEKILDDLEKDKHSVLLSISEDYALENANFHINDVLMGHACTSNYLEWGHPYTYCGKKPEQIIKLEEKAKELGIKVFNNLDDCAEYLNELIK